MTELEELTIEPEENWKTRVLWIGGVVGLLTGLGAAYLFIQRAEKEGAAPQLSGGEGVRLGLLVFSLLRQISQLGEK